MKIEVDASVISSKIEDTALRQLVVDATAENPGEPVDVIVGHLSREVIITIEKNEVGRPKITAAQLVLGGTSSQESRGNLTDLLYRLLGDNNVHSYLDANSSFCVTATPYQLGLIALDPNCSKIHPNYKVDIIR